MTSFVTKEMADLMKSRRTRNMPLPGEPGKRLVGFVFDAKDFAGDDLMLPLEALRHIREAAEKMVRLGSRAYSEDDCPGHVASAADPKVCARCGVHIDSLQPDDEHN